MKAVQRIRKIASIIMLMGFIGSNLLDSFSYVFSEEIFLEAENEIEIMDKNNDLEEGEHFDSKDKTEHSEGNNTDIEEQPEYLEIAGDEEPGTNTGNNEQAPGTNTGNNQQQPETDTGDDEQQPEMDTGDEEPETNTGNNEQEPETNTGNNEQQPETNTGDNEQTPETNTGDNEQQPETTTGNNEQQPETNTGDNEQQPETSTGDNEHEPQTNTDLWEEGEDFNDMVYTGVVRGKEYRITLMDRNLGALTMDSQEEDSYGYYYQWGNNYPFSHHTNLNQYTTQRVDASGYGPDNRFIGEKFIKGHTDWSNMQNDNLWGGEGDNVDNDFNSESNRQGPCPEGYYVPSVGDWHALLSTFLVNNEIDETTTDGWVYPEYIGNERHAGYYIESEDIENFKETFNITYAGRIKNDGTVDRTGTTAHLWTSTPYNGTTLGFEVWDNRINLGGWETTRATAYPIRCFKSIESEYVDYIIKYKDGENETIQTGHRGDILTEPEHEDKGEGYEWLGWYREGEEETFDFATPITGDITLIARWKCADNYHEENGLCESNTKIEECIQTGKVANSTYVVTGVELTWDITGHKWDEIPACEWKCLTDYHLTGGQCESNTKIVDCIQTGKVENSTYIVSGVVITWDITGNNRSETPVCQRICNQHYHLSEGICSIDMFEFTLVENSHVNTSGSTESGQKPYDSKIELEAHSNTGYRFMGWQIIGLQGSGTSITTIDSQVVFNMPDRNVTATPLTDLIEYNIIYNNVKDAVMDNPNTYNIETETFTLNEPTKTGYTFLGWTGSNGLNPEKEVTLTEGNYGNKKYSAVWQPNSGIIYQVVHAVEKADSTSYEVMETEILSGTTDEMTQAVAKEYTGFTAKEIIQKIIKGDGSTVVRVQYQRNIYTITFDSNGGSDVSPITGKYGSNLTAPSNPTRAGYKFIKWEPDFPETMPLGGAELVAQWKKKSSGGSSSSSEETPTPEVTTGAVNTGTVITGEKLEELVNEVENLNVDAGTSVAPMLGNTMKLGAAMLNAVSPVEMNEELEEAREKLNKNKIKGKETYSNVTINVEAPKNSFPDKVQLRIVPITGAEQKQSIKEQLMENGNVTTGSELVSFDVSFVYVTSDGEEIEVQPAEGQKVKVTFNYKNNNKFNKAKKEKDGELKVYHFEKVKNRKGKDTGKVEIKEIEINETESIEGELVIDAEKFSVYSVAAVKGATRGGSAYTIMDQMPTFTWTGIKVQGNDGECLWIMDRDLGASSASTSSIGYYYQWGNNYGFTASWAENHNQGSNQIDIEGLTYYTGDIFVKRNPWHTPNTIYLWGGQGDESSNNWGYGLNDFGERQGPCPQDWHVPSRGEWEKLKAYDSGLSRSSSKYKRTSGGDIKSNNAKIENSSYYYYWTSSPSSTTSSNSFYYAQLASSMSANISRYASYGVKVRCFKNTYNCDGQVIEGGSCDLPWGGTVEDGESVTGYTTSSATCPNACVSATATCNNGEWSVDNFETTYTNQTCTTNPSTCDTSFTLNSTGTNGIYSGCTTYTVNANSCNPGTTKYKLTNCANGYHTENNSTCVSNSKQVACVQNGKPTNSSYITGNVTIIWQGTWNSGNWSATGNCAWKCDSHYHTGEDSNSCEIDTFQITWKDGDGQILKTDTVNYNVVPTYSGPTPTKIATAQYTYTFNDTWSPTPVAATTGATYTAEFNRTINRYDVTFDPNGGNVSPTTMTVMLDSTYGDLPTPIKTGYIFDGWALNDNFGKMVSWEQGGIGDANGSNANNMNNRIRTLYTNINSGTTYYFKLVSSNSYVVRYIHEYTSDKTWVKGTSFNKTSGSFTTSPTTSLIRVVVQYSNASTQISPSDSDNFTLQLNTVNSFETPVYPYLPTTPVTIANDHTLVAIWNPSTYYIAYNANGGVGTAMGNTTCTYDSNCALRNNTYTREGYIFKGWSTSPSATSATYTNGQNVTNLTGSNGNTVTLHAVWEDDTKPVCTRGIPSKIILKSGETGNVVLTCTDAEGISTNSLNSGDILLSNNYVILSNATVAGSATNKTFTFTYTAKANENGSVIFTLPGNKVKDAAGNSALINTNISAVRVDNLQPSCEIKTQPMKPLLKGGQTGSVAFMCISTGTEVSTASLASSSVNYNSNYFTLSNATVTTTEELPDDPSAHLTVVVSTITTPANGESYGLGEEIFYRVEVENDYGNLIIRDITLEDDEGNTWYICSLVPGGVETFLASHVVTKDDIENGEYVKVVTAEGTSQDPDEPDVPVDPGVDPEPTLEVEDFGDDWDLIEDVEQPSSQHINLNAACNNKKIYTFTYTAKSNVDGTGTFTLKSNQVSDAAGNKNAATNQSNVVVVDNTPPTLRYTVTDTPKSTTQTGRMKCTDAGGVTAWYLGNNSPSLSDITSTSDLSILTSDGLTAARVPAGTYYIGCRDTAGNFSTGSATLVSYQVKNMLDKISGTQGTYTTNNYDINSTTPTSSTYYIIPSGTSLTLSNLCTAPTTASTLKITSIGNPGTTAATSATTANAANQTYACWYNRNMYTITYNLNGGTETLTNPTTYTVEDGTFGLYQPTKTGYMFLGWTGSNGTTPNANIYISQGSTGNRTYNAVWGDFENIDAYFISDTGAVSYITLMDRNMGASSDNITSTGSFGFKYQWGNNYGFADECWTEGCSDSVTASATTTKAIWDSSYDNKGYNGTVFVKATSQPYDYWSDSILGNDNHFNLRGGGSDEVSNNWGMDTMTTENIINRQGPCPAGYHVPSIGEWNNLLKYRVAEYTGNGNTLSLNAGGSSKLNYFSDSVAREKFQQDFDIVFAGHRYRTMANIENQGVEAYLWSSSTSKFSNSEGARFLKITMTDVLNNYNIHRALGHSVRCFSNNYMFSQPSMNVVPNGGTGAMILVEGGNVKSLGMPKRDSLSTFGGWHSTPNFAAGSEVSTGDIAPANLYAKWICDTGYTDNGTECVDNTLPTLFADKSSNSRYISDITITLSASDENGLNYAKYSRTSESDCVSNGTSFSSGTTITDNAEGTRTLYLCAEDNAGNTATWTGIYKLDKTNPVCGTWTYEPPLSIWTNGSVVATLAGSTDATAGIQTGGGSCNISTYNGICSVTISDNAGNTNVCTSSGITNIDETKPTCTVSVFPSQIKWPQQGTVTFTCTDMGAGIKTTNLTSGAVISTNVASMTNAVVTNVTNGKSYTFTYTPAAAGTSTFKLAAGSVSDNANNTNDITSQGSVTVQRRNVIITSASDSKSYDAMPLTNDSYTISGDGFATGNGVNCNVTSSQTLVGFSDNIFECTFNQGTNSGNYNISKVYGTLTITDAEVDPDLVVVKIASGGAYRLGDSVTFTIIATNIYDEPHTITLSEKEGVTLAQSTFENVAAGASISTTATYTITEADILAGGFTNTVTAHLGNITKTATAIVETEYPNGHLTVQKETTSETPEGGYKLGDTVTYRITVTNNGNLTITDIVVEDERTGDEWPIQSLAPGDSEVFETYTEVVEEDIFAGHIINDVTARGTSPDPDNPNVPVDPGHTDDDPEEVNPSLDVEKLTTTTPANGESYVLGETIEYEITVTNDGNLTINNIVVEDELTNNIWTGFSLAPGASTGFTTSYVVTESDVIAGSVKNEATADGENESDDPTNPGVGDTDDPTDDNTAPVCTWGAPSKTLLKSGQTGSIVLTCTDEIGIDTNVLTGGDITLSNNYVTLSNATVGGSAKSRTFTFTYTAKSNVNGTVTFTLLADKVSDLLGNFATGVTSSVVKVDNTKPTCTISQSPASGTWTSGNVILRVSVIEDNPDKYSWTGWNNMITTTGTWTMTENGDKTFYVQDKVGNTGSCSITVSNIDKINPSPSSSATYSPKKTTQGWTGSCTDNVGITAYYMGTKSNPSDSDYVTIPSTSSFTTGMVVTQTGTYYRYCKDAAGNVSSTISKTYNAYTVHNMLNAVDKPEGIYNETNYPQATEYTYLASSGTTVSLNNYIYTAPQYATSSTYKGATTAPSGSPTTGMSQNLTSDADFYFWFYRTKYNLNLTVNTGIDAIYYKVNGANSFDSTGINAIVQMKAGSDASVYAEASNCYTYAATSEGNPQSWTNITAAKTFSPTATENTNTITYNMNGGTNNANNPSSYKITQLPIALQGPTRTGYTFKGWTGSNGSTAQTSVSIAGGTCGALTYNAIWQANTYNISYTMNGGTQGANHPVSATYDTPFTVDNPTKVGYTFSGWKITGMDEGVTHYYGDQTTTSTTISSTKATGFNNLTSVSGNTVNFEALWTINQYTAIILAEPSGYGTVSPTSVKKDYNSNITISGNTITIGGTTMTASPKARTAQYTYTFSGWVNNCGDKLTGDCTITAQFDRSINQYTVTVTATPAEWAESITGAGVYNYGDRVTVKLVPLKGYTVTAYMINGERTEVTTHANTYSISQPSLKGNLNIVYELDPTQYRVTFNKNGGTGTMSPQILLYDDEPVALSKNLFTRTGYSFTGWALTTTGGVTFEDEEKVKNILDLSKTRYSINLFAVWELDNYTITYNLNGGTNNANNPSTYTIESGDITLQSPTRVGYTFLGWTGENVDTPQTGVIIPAGSYGNKTYNATWQADTNIHYEIYHYVKKVGENTYVLSDTETKNDGITDATVILSSLAKENEFLCAHYDRGSLTGTENGPGEIVPQTTINGDGSTKIYLYYNRIYYNITLSGDEHVESLEGDGVRECGSERPIDATPKPGYHFVRWDREERERREDDKKS